MAIDRDKYQEAILYFVSECQNVHLGKTKLMKLLYYLDFDHFEQYGTPVTGDTYRKFDYGPLPQHASMMIVDLEREGLISRETRSVFVYQQERYTPNSEPNLDVFSDTELRTLQAVCDRWKVASRHEIVEATHNEAPWIAVESGAEIPYQYAYYRNKFGELDEPEDDDDLLTVDELMADGVRE